jgi:rhodanese-related sulfurtransferase
MAWMGKTYVDYVREALRVVGQTSLEDARAAFDAGPAAATFLDIREPNEIAIGAIPDALVIPRGRLESDAPDWLFDPHGRIICYCSSGKRSALAAKTLQEMGFTNVTTLAGGYAAWRDGGQPIGPPRAM